MEKTFNRVRSVKDIVISASIIILGIVLLLLSAEAGVDIAGYFFILAGLILLFILKSDYKDAETGIRYKRKEYYFEQSMNASIASALATNPASIDIKEAGKGESVMLDIYYSKDSGKAYLQLFKYIPYEYEPCSKVYEYEIAKVEKLLK